MTPESKENGVLRKWFKLYGIVAIRMALQPGVETGWPDWLLPLPGGRCIFIEMKRPAAKGKKGTKPSERQAEKLDLLVKLGHVAFWVQTAAEAIEIVTMLIGRETLEGMKALADAERAPKV